MFHKAHNPINGENPVSPGRKTLPPEGGGSPRSEEKVKPFRLVKYFSYTSLLVIFSGTIVLAVLNTHWARAMQNKKSEDYALLLVENLNHQIFLQFIIPVALKFGKIQLRNQEQFDRMDKVVRSTLHTFKVEMVNIYDLNNTVSYSFERERVGRKDQGGPGYQAALAGEARSRLVQEGDFWELMFGFPRESRIITFAPLRAEKPLSRLSGPVLGVVEIVQDLSDEYQAIFRFQIRIILTSSVVMGALLLVLIFVVKRGENIIDRRTLEQMRLKEKLSRAERLSSLGEMVAGISHEIRNPLGIIRSSAELLKKRVHKTDPGNTIPDIIVEEAGRLNTIITDFLDYARPKAPNLSPCRVERIVEKNLNFLAPQMREQGYAVQRDYENLLPPVRGDEDMLYQAILNILINAMQAMPDGGTIGIAISQNGQGVTMSVTDQGTGVPDAVMGKIWDPFFTTKDMGTGLGLGIVKNIIEAHGGTVALENIDPQGAKVTLNLPLSDRGGHGNHFDRG